MNFGCSAPGPVRRQSVRLSPTAHDHRRDDEDPEQDQGRGEEPGDDAGAAGGLRGRRAIIERRPASSDQRTPASDGMAPSTDAPAGGRVDGAVALVRAGYCDLDRVGAEQVGGLLGEVSRRPGCRPSC